MSENAKASASASGIGFFGLLTIAFIVLKLLGIIDWSWWLVLLPLFIPVLVVVLIIVFLLIIDR